VVGALRVGALAVMRVGGGVVILVAIATVDCH